MELRVQRYFNLLTSLLPRGLAWAEAESNNLGELLNGLAEELARVDSREDDLLDEADPRTTYELLSEWETAFGLPDPCIGSDLTLSERLATLFSKVTNKGGQSKQFFIDLALSLGYEVTITEFSPFDANSTAAELLYSEAWQFAWQVNAPEETVTYFDAASDADMPLADWGNERLECAINRLKPAHTTVLFSYGG